MEIISKAQATQSSTHSVLIYGDPGVGKTSFACSTPNPLLLPFDKAGALRAVSDADMVQLTNWQDAKEFAMQPLGTFDAYDTVVVDTVGKLLDSVATYVIQQNPGVNQQRGSSALSMKGYGAMKSEFQEWFKLMQAHKLNLVFIAHAKETDDTTRPDIVGGSQTIVLQEVDAVAYMTINNGQRVANFAPTAQYYGKDCARLGEYKIAELPIADFDSVGTMQHVIISIRSAIKANIAAIQAAKAAYLMVSNKLKTEVQESETIVGAVNCALAYLDEAKERDAKQTEVAMLTKTAATHLTTRLEGEHDLEAINYVLSAVLESELLAKYKTLKAAIMKAAERSGFAYDKEQGVFA